MISCQLPPFPEKLNIGKPNHAILLGTMEKKHTDNLFLNSVSLMCREQFFFVLLYLQTKI